MIRPAEAADIPAIHQLIRDLAEFEKALSEVTTTEADLRRALLGRRPAVFAHVAENDGEVVGFALWFLNFSTWTGQHGIYLEDLYVRADQRRSGLGRALLAELARICVARGYARLEWSVLDWNSPARRFYASLGAVEMDEWTVNRLAGPCAPWPASAPEPPPALLAPARRWWRPPRSWPAARRCYWPAVTASSACFMSAASWSAAMSVALEISLLAALMLAVTCSARLAS